MIYDYVIVGAGPAGCICAAGLKRKNLSVRILEKNPPGCRKVCGDGIGFGCVQALEEVGFPLDRLTAAGAVPIKQYIHYIDGKKYTDNLAEHNKRAFGMPRDALDGMLREYVSGTLGIAIDYDMPVRDILKVGGGFEVCGIQARKVVLAAGASAAVRLDGKPLLRPNVENPVGLSGIVRASAATEPFFLFDYQKQYDGAYAWIFSVGQEEYNVGIWLKQDKTRLKKLFYEFLETRGREYLGDYMEWIREPKGALMGIGEKRLSPQDGIVFIGDAANGSNPKDGEGISRAIRDAENFVRQA
jgi:flavin-dependent dehydrogenase